MVTVPRLEDLNVNEYDGSSDDEYGPSRYSSKLSNHSSKYSRKSSSNKDFTRAYSEDSDLIGPVPQSASLQRRTSYGEIKQQQQQKLKKAGALGMSDREPANRPSGYT